MDPNVQHQHLMQNRVRAGAYADGTDFEAWQGRARARMEALLGLPMEPCEPRLRVEWTREEALFHETRFSFHTEPRFETHAHLLLPKDGVRPMPLVICLQGHTTGMHISLGRAKYPNDDQSISGGDRDFALQAVRQGYAALALEQRGFGECSGSPAEPKDCHQLSVTALLLGRTAIGERVWDVMRALDVIEAFPQIDPKRVAVMGNSGGGTTAFYAAAMDGRLWAAMPSCAFSRFPEASGTLHHCVCHYIPGILKHFDMGDVAGLIAPRPLVIVSAEHDAIAPIESTRAEFEVVRRYYAAAGAPEMCRHIVGPEGHRFYAALSWPVFGQLTGWRAQDPGEGRSGTPRMVDALGKAVPSGL